MTNDELDNLASAYVDGEATPAEVAQVESDPDAMRRVAALRSVTARVGAVPSTAGVSPKVKAAQIRAALDAVDPAPASVEPEPFIPADTTVIDLTSRRGQAAGARSRRLAPAWLGAAAVIALFAGGFALLNTANGANKADETASVEPTAETMADSLDEAPVETTISEDTETEAADAVLVEEAPGGDEALSDGETDTPSIDATRDDGFREGDDAAAEADHAAPSTSTTQALTETTPSASNPPEPSDDNGGAALVPQIDLFALAEDNSAPWANPSSALCESGPVDFSPVGQLAGVLAVIVDGQRQEVLLYTESGAVGSTTDARTLVLVDQNCALVDTNI